MKEKEETLARERTKQLLIEDMLWAAITLGEMNEIPARVTLDRWKKALEERRQERQ